MYYIADKIKTPLGLEYLVGDTSGEPMQTLTEEELQECPCDILGVTQEGVKTVNELFVELHGEETLATVNLADAREIEKFASEIK